MPYVRPRGGLTRAPVPLPGRCSVNGRVELCRRCGSRLDPVLIAQDWDRHPACYREPVDDRDLAQALLALADAFPDARVVRETDPAPRPASGPSPYGPCARCGGVCVRYGPNGGSICCRSQRVAS